MLLGHHSQQDNLAKILIQNNNETKINLTHEYAHHPQPKIRQCPQCLKIYAIWRRQGKRTPGWWTLELSWASWTELPKHTNKYKSTQKQTKNKSTQSTPNETKKKKKYDTKVWKQTPQGVCSICWPFWFDWACEGNLPRSWTAKAPVSFVIWLFISLLSSTICVNSDSNFWFVLLCTSMKDCKVFWRELLG